METPPAHIRTLDGARGLAILLVMVWHMTVVGPTPMGKAIFQATSFGWTGVELFFVLSGMLITGILLDSKGGESYFKNFYIRRALRIWPLYYAILIVSFYVLPHLPMLPAQKFANFSRVASSQGWYWLFLQNYSIAAAGAYRHGIMDVTWSLAIEEQFYLLWPLLVVFLSRRALAWTLGGLIAASLVGRLAMLAAHWSPIAIYVLTPVRLDSLCVGALLALAVRGGLGRKGLKRASGLGLALGGVTIAAIFVAHQVFVVEDPWVESIGLLALAVFYGGFLAAAVLVNGSGSWLDRLLSGRVLGAFGLYSYCLYLVHLPLRALLRDAVLKPAGFAAFPGGELGGQLVFFAAAIALSFAVAAASYHLFEKRFLRLKGVLARSPVRARAAPLVVTESGQDARRSLAVHGDAS